MMKCEKLFCCWGGVPSFRSISRGKTNPSGLVANGNVANDNNTNVVFENIRASKSELQLGPMKVYKHPMEVLLIFGSDDGQSDAFISGAKRGGYKYKLQYTTETAMDYYLKKLPELVIIDLRSNVYFDGETLCRNIRSTRPNVNTVIVGVTKKNEQEDISIVSLLKCGFNRRFVEDHNTTTCLNELIMLDTGEVSSQCKLRATSCLFSAVEHAYDAIEIQCVDPEKTEFQYVNPAYEKVTGYWRNEVVGNSKNNILSNCEVPKPDSHENISKLLSKGKTWEGVCIARKKSGEQFVQSLKIVPIIGHAGRVTHYVVVKRDLSAMEKDTQIQQMHQELRKVRIERGPDKAVPATFSITHNTAHVTVNSLSIKAEAPITKVINMLNAVQEDSPLNVVQVLEKVIDILRTTELYTPSSLDQVEEKGIERDLVEGLMWNFRERRHSADSNVKGFVQRDSNLSTSLIHGQKVFQVTQAPPDIQEVLQNDDKWEYDILKLERVSNKRPLYYLGQTIFNRFNVGVYLSISDTVVRNWLQLIEANYHMHNAYHNSTHAADVLHATSVFLQRDDVKNTLERSDEIAALIAAVVHDVDHPGFTNSFLCNAGSELAVLYNDIAVLESHHAAMAFKLTSRDMKSNIFQNLQPDEFKLIRQSVIDMVMATEMKQHFEHLAKFENNFNKRHTSHEDGSANGRATPESISSSHLNIQSPENRAIVKRMIIKCADIANPARPTLLCREWAYRIAEEYFRQTEEEKKRNLPIVMPVFDRNTCNVPKSQLFFIDYFVNNLYSAWDKFAQVPEAMECLRANYEYWSDEADKLEKEKESVGNGNSDS
ncbi:high affinity cAMP-specific and IBMX-insensitive 3',5'-cyclic phosphodiesterase 8B-like isoform X2 [Hydractinia symbiolongicarpus]|uniref:high affinity cAMP-specific and IBMX-insensitive 3',5'-cyclic phosphodiesterase 8B-like isoform X2 n=1 Tax=Hydractinia symbiolongicarpus TaxID=13093 RepID=UPI00254A7268|nr:high affinity cAMP-specific and IBMX-insensitive 3',5'-cyclic phosphodiesterase 8B-like isoform X2 [Hydractinia symbiolongicarpus]